jgi:hypothetical protein
MGHDHREKAMSEPQYTVNIYHTAGSFAVLHWFDIDVILGGELQTQSGIAYGGGMVSGFDGDLI